MSEVRRQTRAEKKRLAMAMREKQLGALGMQVGYCQSVNWLVHPHLRFILHGQQLQFKCGLRVRKCNQRAKLVTKPHLQVTVQSMHIWKLEHWILAISGLLQILFFVSFSSLQTTEGGKIIAKASTVIQEMEQLHEESGLVCCICREGYKYHPQKVSCACTFPTVFLRKNTEINIAALQGTVA